MLPIDVIIYHLLNFQVNIQSIVIITDYNLFKKNNWSSIHYNNYQRAQQNKLFQRCSIQFIPTRYQNKVLSQGPKLI